MTTLLSASCSGQNPDSSDSAKWSREQLAAYPVRVATPLGNGMGIQVQPWYIKPDDLAQISAAGFGIVRWGIAWERIEKVRGIYDWAEVDQFVGALARSGLRSIVILGYGNHLYSKQQQASQDGVSNELVEAQAPSTVEARAAFALFAAAAAARYRDQPITWEIWNEPDNSAFWQPMPNPTDYAALANQTCVAIRAASPFAKVLGGAGAAMPNVVAQNNNIYGALVRGRALNCLDGISSHAYRMSTDYSQPDPESIEGDNRASRAYLYLHLGVPANKDFVTTEWGFTTYNISANLQAAYLIRANLVNAATGVPLTIWYEWRDSRPDTDNPESHFGIMSTQQDQKNTNDALAILSRIAHARFVRRLFTGREDVWALLLQSDATNLLVAWRRTNDETQRSRLYVNGAYRGDISFMPTIVELAKADTLKVYVE